VADKTILQLFPDGKLKALAELQTGSTVNGNTIWHAGNDGSGSGLDADTVKGYTPVNKAGDTMTGVLTLSGDPTSALHATTKQYVDSVAQGLIVKDACKVATTGNVTLSGTQTIDGVSVAAGDRVLVKNQSTASQNGIYTAASSTWSRAADADSSDEVKYGMFIYVSQGTTNGGTGWVMSTSGTITLGTTAINFTQFSGSAQISAEEGLYRSGNAVGISAGGVTDAKLGNRTITDTTAPSSDSGTLTTLLSNVGNVIKGITGKSSWRTAPATTLESAKSHIDASAPHSGHETPSGAQTKVDTHSSAVTGVHGVGTSRVAKTSRTDQWPAWADIPDKPSTFAPAAHKASHASGGGDALTPNDIGAASSSHTHNKSQITDFPSSMTPTVHAESHKTGGTDALSPATIGAAEVGHTHTLPEASTSVKGIVQLSDSVTNTSTVLAATANAVKTAYDKGNHSHPYAATSHTHAKGDITDFAHAHAAGDLPSASTSAAGIVQLNDTVSSTSTVLAATANAVKAAYDKANHSHPYAATSHTHGGGDITSAVANANAVPWTGVTGKPSTFTPTAHTHAAADLPAASTSAAGIVQLNNTTSSTSTTLAATANAVKIAYDKAVAVRADSASEFRVEVRASNPSSPATGRIWLIA